MSRRIEEKRLIEEWQAGKNKEEIFQVLFERYSPPVSHFFKKHGFPDEDCLDLTQETFIKVHKGLPGFRFESTFETWLFQIVRHIRINALRDQSASKRQGEEIPLDANEGGDVLFGFGVPDSEKHDPGPLANTLVKERLRLLRDRILDLPVTDQICLFLCAWGFKYREISDLLGIPLGTVKTRIFKAREFLKEPQLDNISSDE